MLDKYQEVYVDGYPEILLLEDKIIKAFTESAEALSLDTRTRKQRLEIARGFLMAYTFHGKLPKKLFNVVNRFLDCFCGSEDVFLRVMIERAMAGVVQKIPCR